MDYSGSEYKTLQQLDIVTDWFRKVQIHKSKLCMENTIKSKIFKIIHGYPEIIS